jgi:hypothetical protein
MSTVQEYITWHGFFTGRLDIIQHKPTAGCAKRRTPIHYAMLT